MDECWAHVRRKAGWGQLAVHAGEAGQVGHASTGRESGLCTDGLWWLHPSSLVWILWFPRCDTILALGTKSSALAWLLQTHHPDQTAGHLTLRGSQANSGVASVGGNMEEQTSEAHGVSC